MSLSIEYAKNRIALKEIKKKISSFYSETDEDGNFSNYDDLVNLLPARAIWYECNPGANWPGWVVVLEHFEEFTEADMGVAKLLDERKKIIIEGGKIKQRIYAEGIRLMKSA